MTDPLKLQRSRGKLYQDFYTNKIPDRMPIGVSLPNHLLAEYDSQNLFDFQYDYSKLKNPASEICREIYSDQCPVLVACPLVIRYPFPHQLYGSKAFVMGKSGIVSTP